MDFSFHLSSEMNSKSRNDFILYPTGSENNKKEDLIYITPMNPLKMKLFYLFYIKMSHKHLDNGENHLCIETR